MKLADWQKKEIEPSIHDFAASRHNDLNVIYGAIENATSGGMRTNGPDYITRDIRDALRMAASERGPELTSVQLEGMTLAVRRLVRDLMP
jgi:hypothetical protein